MPTENSVSAGQGRRFGGRVARSGPGRVAVVVLCAVVGLAALTSTPAAASNRRSVVDSSVAGAVSFGYTGGAQNWVVPAGVSQVQIDARGAQGQSNFGGLGGETIANIPVTAGQSVAVLIGGAGANSVGGFNGGGSAAAAGFPYGAGGGGATDVRMGGTDLASRVIVAGGGGGALNASSTRAEGGAGGGVAGGNGEAYGSNVGGLGGTQTAGGQANGSGSYPGGAGSLGQGGQGCCNSGGGGGYYGGGSGTADSSGYNTGGGGGGSSFSAATATSVSMMRGANSGDGALTITYPAPAAPPSYQWWPEAA